MDISLPPRLDGGTVGGGQWRLRRLSTILHGSRVNGDIRTCVYEVGVSRLVVPYRERIAAFSSLR